MKGQKKRTFVEFQDDVCRTLDTTFDKLQCNPSWNWEHLYDMLESTDNYHVIDFAELRLTPILHICAALLVKMYDKRVVVVEPTLYYATQAVNMLKRWGLLADDMIKSRLSIVVALDDNLIERADVIMMHGRRFDGIKVKEKQRLIIHLFEGEEVPHDPRSISVCMRTCCE